MKNQDSYRRGRHCVSDLKAHLVFVTKYRRGVLTVEHLERMRHIFNEVCYKLEARLIEFNGEDDHVHLLVEYPPKLAISTLVNSLKGVSSRKLRAEFFIKTRTPMVAFLLCSVLWWCANRKTQRIYQATANSLDLGLKARGLLVFSVNI